ncbi:hypothetical protein [Heliorestis acidaminivorans]|nr:hypothetical protein [Heliorestis acidaminivorans]
MFKTYLTDNVARKKIKNAKKILAETKLFDRNAEPTPAKSLKF